MALIHPRSLERWQEWQESRHRVRRAKHAITGAASSLRGRTQEPPPGWILHSREGTGEVTGGGRLLIAVDSASPTSRASLLTALPYLHRPVDVLAPADVPLAEVADDGWTRTAIPADRPGAAGGPDALGGPDAAGGPGAADGSSGLRRVLAERGISTVVSLGQHLRTGRAVHDWALAAGAGSAVVQHGALTPFAPPLPERTTLLAWSDADAEFYRSGRSDIGTRTIGSQLLWQARHESDGAVEVDGPPVFLGQMHGAELPRRNTAGTALRFCRAEGAIYRPHPSETDVISRTVHQLMRRRGIVIEDAGVPLRELSSPVVGIFSTGVLEAAVRGLPSYVVGDRVPAWVREFWDRYGMRRWGGEPTPAPEIGADEPARLLAQALEETS